jgi:hypothetical protein
MNMLSRMCSEGSQNQSATDSRGSPMLISADAASCSLDLDFLLRTGSKDATSGPGRGDGGRRSFTPSDVLNGTLEAL